MRERAANDDAGEGAEAGAEVEPRSFSLRDLKPREIFFLFTAGWLGGQGALALVGAHASWPERIVGGAELAAAVLWFVPRLKLAGFGAMLAVLAVAAVRQFVSGQLPGALIFYAAVVFYLAVEEERAKPLPPLV
jgi:hypothetical protein